MTDDFDRIDPEHVFRILNIFAAYFDDNLYNGKGKLNKFGFDKIIIVCDYNNLKSIFHHKYGSKTDFGGYINQFYSKKPFEVKNIVEDYCKQILDTLTFQPPDDIITNERILFNILPIINGLYKYNYISLRSILNIVNINFKSPNIDGVGFSFRKYHIAYQLNILKFLCGDLDSLLDGLKILKSEKYSIEGFESSAKMYFILYCVHT